MSAKPKILAFTGSARKGSYNKLFVKIAAEGARNAGAEVTVIDLKDFPLSVYNQDDEDEKGIPENAMKLKELFKSHQGLLISSPENNSSVSALLKNTLDWVSREAEGELPLACFTGKVAALVSASPGGLGGLRGLVHLRAMLGNINVLVLPDQMALPKAHEAFAEDGSLKDAKQKKGAERVGAKLAKILSKLAE
jgi:chromate reductase